MAENMGKLSIAITATTKGLEAAAKKTTGILKSLAGSATSLPGILGAAGTAAAGKGLIDIADSYTVMGSQLEFVAGNAEDAAFAQEDLYEISKKTGTKMSDNVASYIKLNQASKLTGLTAEENIEVIGAINALMIKTGTSGAQASAAMLQLGQAMTSGKLAGDEYRSMAENAPGLLYTLADAMGIPTEELKEMSSQGELTSERLAQAFLSIVESGDVAFEDLPQTASKGMNAVTLAFQSTWAEISSENGIMAWIHDALMDLTTQIEDNAGEIGEWVTKGWGEFLDAWPDIKQAMYDIGAGIKWVSEQIIPTINFIKTLVEWLSKAIDLAQEFSPLGRLAAAAGSAVGAYETGEGVTGVIGAAWDGLTDVGGSGTTIINNVNTSMNKKDAEELGIMGDTAEARI